MSAETWCLPVSRSASFRPLKIGRSGQPVQRPGGRGSTASGSTGEANGLVGSSAGRSSAGSLTDHAPAWYLPRKSKIPLVTAAEVYSPATGSMSLPCSATSEPARRRIAFRFCSM